ncbi:helix-turn-helix domain-containing protein [Streptomyces noursei]|uniref:helix-turn-helix domain-containing protein n=1 Tax=Streptomyces noursei TaxID=1971 RepID=UPI001F185532|nr:helix-turn-helix transcriptional regulator [Streptomyces noursei]MCE4943259.1 helix-turn-helix transcriptional regulator [Streptomyces noursei]
MRGVPGHENDATNVRRKPLAPLPAELSGPARDFVSALRRMHGELGYSLQELAARLPASRSSLSRYLRGQSLPDERLLVQWCKLSFTGEDRLPALVELLHHAQEAADEAAPPATEPPAAAEPDAAAPTDREIAEEVAGADPREAAPGRRRLRLVLAGLGTAAVLAGAAFAVMALTGSDADGRVAGDGRASAAAGAGPAAGSARITVNNIERACRHSRTDYCALGLARDPYAPYLRPNVVGRVWHGDVLQAICKIADGISVTDEAGGHSSIWFRVDHDGGRAWMPGIRVRPGQLDDELPRCPN